MLSVGWAAGKLIVNPLLNLLVAAGATRTNYCGQRIPNAGGLAIVLPATLAIGAWGILHGPGPWYHPFLFGLWAMALLGLLDDLVGNREVLGFRGHTASLLQGRLTTGGLKMVGGGLVALVASLPGSPGMGWLLLNGLVIALASNTINLFDLRPGRAVKIFILGSVLLLFTSTGETLLYLMAVAGATLAYFPKDLKAKTMLGDTGSNVLGMSLGLVTITLYNTTVMWFIVGVLLGIHLLAEKYSITVIIEKIPTLDFLDRLGREKQK